MSTTTVRKLRFPMLIGGGIIAAGILVYFSHGYINSQKTQGAIGQRDVYRDGEVKASDVAATPGAAPVAVKAILESKEFQSLAKNPAFSEVLHESTFQSLSTNQGFVRLLSNSQFAELTHDPAFQALAQSNALGQAVASVTSNLRSFSNQNSSVQNAQIQALANNASFVNVVHNSNFASLASNSAFNSLVASSALQSLMRLGTFTNLASQTNFQNALLAGNAANLSTGLLREF